MYKVSVKIPPGFVNVMELCTYIEKIFDVTVVPNSTPANEIVILTDFCSELEDAHNLALLFIGPESKVQCKPVSKILKMCTIPAVQRYLARGFKLIVTSIDDTHLLLRGPKAAVAYISKVIEEIQLVKYTRAFVDEDIANLCLLHHIDVKQLTKISKELRSLFREFISRLESPMGLQYSAARDSHSDNTCESGFLEVFRQNKCLENQDPQNLQMDSLNVYNASPAASALDDNRKALDSLKDSCRKVQQQVNKQETNHPLPADSGEASFALSDPPKEIRRLRPVIIDGANVAHGESSSSAYNAQNLLIVVDYFVQRGHQEIAVVLPSDGQSLCSTLFSPTDIIKYFIFTPVRRFDRILRPQRTDDDSVILQYALERNGVVISNDQYRNWLGERPEFRDLIENRQVVP